MKMTHKGTQILETERLILRPFRTDDAEPMFRNWALDPEAAKFLTWSVHENIDVTKSVVAFWCSRNEDFTQYQWAIELKEAGEAIGSISVLKSDDNTGTATIGYCIGSSWWGLGIMPEALNAVPSSLRKLDN